MVHNEKSQLRFLDFEKAGIGTYLNTRRDQKKIRKMPEKYNQKNMWTEDKTGSKSFYDR